MYVPSSHFGLHSNECWNLISCYVLISNIYFLYQILYLDLVVFSRSISPLLHNLMWISTSSTESRIPSTRRCFNVVDDDGNTQWQLSCSLNSFLLQSVAKAKRQHRWWASFSLTENTIDNFKALQLNAQTILVYIPHGNVRVKLFLIRPAFFWTSIIMLSLGSDRGC